jgi:hypothetical protein
VIDLPVVIGAPAVSKSVPLIVLPTSGALLTILKMLNENFAGAVVAPPVAAFTVADFAEFFAALACRQTNAPASTAAIMIKMITERRAEPRRVDPKAGRPRRARGMEVLN